MSQPPEILRIKRKRNEDPLQALILEHTQPAKKSKPSTPIRTPVESPRATPDPKNYFFELERTDEAQKDQDVVNSVLLEAKSSKNARQFVIPKKHSLEDTVIPNELADMVNSFLNVDSGTTRKKRRRRAPSEPKNEENTEGQVEPKIEQAPKEPELDEYVFDVYRLNTSKPLTNANYPLLLIGYIRFFDDEDYNLMQLEEEKSDVSDDEDSNAESFYQNDYPEDEDAGAYSDTYEEPADEKELFVNDEELEDLYDEFFDENGNQQMDLLANDSEFERQNFFPDEEEDEMALHRDKIFGKLQNMIDEA